VIRYSYNRQIDPPAPFIHVTLRCIEIGTELSRQAAQLDIAADRTVLPGQLATTLRLVPLDEIEVAGFGGQIFTTPTYRVQIAVHDFDPIFAECIAHNDEPFILLGRDVLNHYRLLLDGPQLSLEIG
jgi:hypothetical protein